jgi:hypothetical protein
MSRDIWFDMGDTAWDIYHVGNYEYGMRDMACDMACEIWHVRYGV